MEIALDDQKLYNLQLIINDEKNKLLKKYNELQSKTQNNQYLEKIAENYKQYNSRILQQKKEQRKAFEKLLCYFQSISMTLKKTDEELDKALLKEKELEQVIKNLDGEIKEIIS